MICLQTPASRKFAPPSSTPSAPSSRRSGFANRFLRSSQAPSSPYTKTPFSSTAKQSGGDDIEADGDNDHLVQPPLVSILESTWTHQQEVDNRSDDNGGGPIETNTQTLRTSTQQESTTTHSHQSNNQISSTAKRRKLAHFTPNAELIEEATEYLSSSPPPSPSLSSRPRTQPGKSSRSSIQIPHSSPTILPLDHAQSERDPNNDDSPNTDPEDHSPPAPHLTTPKHLRSSTSTTTTRFKQPQPSSPIPNNSESYPSFQSRLLSSTAPPSSITKAATTTITSPHPPLRPHHPIPTPTLPDAFSPSRKRGAISYVPTGHAETTRSWILNVALRTTSPAPALIPGATARSQHQNQNQQQNQQQQHRKICVQKILTHDPADRFMLVVCTNHNDTARSQPDSNPGLNSRTRHTIWLLTNTNTNSNTTSTTNPQTRPYTTTTTPPTSKFSLINPGSVIAIQGGDAAVWSTELDIGHWRVQDLASTRRQSDSVNDNEEFNLTNSMSANVAVLWDIIPDHV